MRNKALQCNILLLVLLIPFTLYATVNIQTNADGTRFTNVLFNGSTTAKYDIVFVGDGFTSSSADQMRFNNAVNDAVTAMRNKHPYADNMCSFNIWRVNVISQQSGIDHSVSGVFKTTELNCTFGNNTTIPERVIYSTTPDLVTEAADYAPAADAIYVLVNDEEYGGAAGNIVYTSLEARMQEVVVHELGHFVGGLADEYTCRFCDGRPEPVYSGPEPWQVNITMQTNRSLIKWRSFINASTPIPTTSDVPAGVVGLWLGGGYSPSGIYRPQRICLMQLLYTEMCAVCSNHITKVLNPYCTACERDPNSLACRITILHSRIYLYEQERVFRIPICCFCPLDIDIWKSEIELNVNPQTYRVDITSNGIKVDASIRQNEKGHAVINFSEQKGADYFLTITPLQKLDQQQEINLSLSRNGQQSVLF